MVNTTTTCATIRKASPDDFLALAEIARLNCLNIYGHILSIKEIEDYLNTEYSIESLEKAINQDREQIYVLINEQGQVFAQVAFSPKTNYLTELLSLQNQPVPQSYEVSRLFCHPEFHGQGFGKQLMDFAEAKIQELNIPTIHLIVNKDNIKAVQLYQRRGYEILGELDTSYGSVKKTDYVMLKTFGSSTL